MAIFLLILYYVLWLLWLLVLIRLVLETVQSFARDWRPRGVAVVLMELLFTVTDPPIKLLRKLIPPLPLGRVRLDLSAMILLIGLMIGMWVVRSAVSYPVINPTGSLL